MLYNSFIYSGYFCSTSSSPILLRGAPGNSIETVLELTRQSATVSEGLAQSPYVAARVGFIPATHRMQGIKLTTEPTRPTIV